MRKKKVKAIMSLGTFEHNFRMILFHELSVMDGKLPDVMDIVFELLVLVAKNCPEGFDSGMEYINEAILEKKENLDTLKSLEEFLKGEQDDPKDN